MAETISRLDLIKYRIEDFRKRYEIWRLRRTGELERILEESPYTYIHPGGMGHYTYDVIPKTGPVRQQDVLFGGSREHDALLWIVKRFKSESDGARND